MHVLGTFGRKYGKVSQPPQSRCIFRRSLTADVIPFPNHSEIKCRVSKAQRAHAEQPLPPAEYRVGKLRFAHSTQRDGASIRSE
jgi:hypothetical protein